MANQKEWSRYYQNFSEATEMAGRSIYVSCWSLLFGGGGGDHQWCREVDA